MIYKISNNLMSFVFVLAAVGCGPVVRQWNIPEGQKNLDLMLAQQGQIEPSSPQSPRQGSISVNLVVPQSMGCVLLVSDDADKAAGHKMGVCHMTPIAGQDPVDEVKTLWKAESGKKASSKAGFALLDVGIVIQSELERSLKKYYQNVDVRLVDEAHAKDAIHADAITFYPIWAGKDVTMNVQYGEYNATGSGHIKIEGKHAAWFFPTMILSIPAFMWAPMIGMGIVHDVAGSKAVVASIRAAMEDLAKQIYQNNGRLQAVQNGSPKETTKEQNVSAAADENEQKVWSVGYSGQTTGPFTAVEIQKMIDSNEVAADALVWKAGMSDWAPLKETEPFKSGVQTTVVAVPTAVPAATATSGKIWRLGQNGQISGPYTALEIKQMLDSSGVAADALVWKEGMADWAPLKETVPFKAFVKSTAAAAAEAGAVEEPKEWMVVVDGKSTGPYSTGEVQQMLSSGQLRSDTHVWKEGMAAWTPCNQIKVFQLTTGQ